jgi:hypothetical protein
MRRPFSRLTAGLFTALVCAAPAAAQFDSVFATPLPPGPGTVPYIPNGKLAAPVLLPVGAPTAAPVAIYHYGPTPATPAGGVDCGQITPCAATKHGGRWWASAEFLYGATQGVWLPPLVTAGPPTAPPGEAGALYNPNGVILFGGRRELTSTRPGFLLRGGYWFDDAQTHGLDAGLIYLGGLSRRFVGLSGPGGVVLARPIVGSGGDNVGVPAAGPFPGGITASADTWFIGGDVNYRRGLLCGECCRVDVLAGYRYLHLGDTVDVWTASDLDLLGLVPGPAGMLVHDTFRTRNHFHGPQVGLITSCRLPSGLTLELTTKVAMGVTVAEANTLGTTLLPGGGVVPTGLLVMPTNTVADRTNYFAVVPEAGLRVGYCLTECLKATAGYTFLYWSRVRRAAEQIDLTVDPAVGRPAFRNDRSDFWVQGWTLGLELRY